MKLGTFFKLSVKLLMVILIISTFSCKETSKEKKESVAEVVGENENSEPFFKLSLAQWSMNKMIRNEGVDPYAFAEKSKSWGFEGLEYVSGLYYPTLEKDNFSDAAMKNFVDRSNEEAKKYGLTNLLIMVDGQGALAASDPKEREEAVENHHKWVDAAAAMGCHSIRVNLSGETEPQAWITASVDGLTQLATYAKDKNINIIVENHGGNSSDGSLLAAVMEQVGMDNCGTLPDFGNFCMEWAEWPNCNQWYDRYKGVTELMPYAKAVSAKSMDFDENGNEIHTDYMKMMKIVKDAGYQGFVGVEYEGSELSEEEGILATKELLLKVGSEL